MSTPHLQAVQPSPDAPRESRQADEDKPTAAPVAQMTSSQLKRRVKIVDAVIELIAESGAEEVQMRDVAQRAGVALATVYNYFDSKEDLLAAALQAWQKRVVQRVLAEEPPDQDPVGGILDYLRISQRAARVEPEMTALVLQVAMSNEPGARVAMDQMLHTNVEILGRLVDIVAPEDLQHVAFGLSATLSGSLTGLLTGRLTLEKSMSHVEWVARVLLGKTQPRVRK